MPIGYEIRKEGLKAKITHVETKKAKDIFKNAKIPDQSLIAITADVNGLDTRVGFIPEPPSKYVSPKSKMAAFIQNTNAYTSSKHHLGHALEKPAYVTTSRDVSQKPI